MFKSIDQSNYREDQPKLGPNFSLIIPEKTLKIIIYFTNIVKPCSMLKCPVGTKCVVLYGRRRCVRIKG